MKPRVIAFAVAAVFAGGAHAQTLDSLLHRDALQQHRIADDIARGRIDEHNAAMLEQRAGNLYQLESRLLSTPSADHTALMRVRQAENDLAGAITWAEKHRAGALGSPLDRMRLHVASTRDAQQQRLIASEVSEGRLTSAQMGALESAQARIARAEADAVRGKRGETLATAESIQHMQDLQDYAILKDPSLA